MTDSRTQLEAAIAAQVAEDKPGHYVSDWFMVVQAQSPESDTSYYRVVMPATQAFHASEGLARIGVRVLADIWDVEDDDD